MQRLQFNARPNGTAPAPATGLSNTVPVVTAPVVRALRVKGFGTKFVSAEVRKGAEGRWPQAIVGLARLLCHAACKADLRCTGAAIDS